MKSKSFDLRKSSGDRGKLTKTFDFVGLYKSASETVDKVVEKQNSPGSVDKENSFSNSEGKRNKSPSKKKKPKHEPLDISQITIDGRNLSAPSVRSSPVQATSTPNAGRRSGGGGGDGLPKVRSIMKTSQPRADDVMAGSTTDTPPEKRNKSVSFMLDDTDEVAVKKTKSEESILSKKDKPSKLDKKKHKKFKKSSLEKENTVASPNSMETETVTTTSKKWKAKVALKIGSDGTGDTASDVPMVTEKKKKSKKIKNRKNVEYSSEPAENNSNNNEDSTEHKPRKLKKKKHSKTETAEGEPAKKLKKEVKPEIIAEDLENLSIGDNPHTLTNLLDEMTVVDKDKKKKNKLRKKKTKEQKPGSISSSETADLEKIDECKEKIKWKKRKWNKDKKGDHDEEVLNTSVIVDNLPIKIMCNYKKILAEHFGKLGLIKRVGIAELYPTEEPKPVFTTTIVFYSEGAATEALEEDNTVLEGGRIRVRRPLPATQTTVVVRSYAELTEQALSGAFSAAGRVRNIRHLVKGKKAKATAFIEFDGPESVERAIKMAEDAKIGGKKIHVSKFELRGARRKVHKAKQPHSENEGDSENSND